MLAVRLRSVAARLLCGAALPVLALPLLSPPAMARALLGPPLLCHPFEIGTAASLPFGKGIMEADTRLGADEVLQRTLELVTGEDAVVRMETLRRAAISLVGNPKQRALIQAEALVAALAQRHQDAAVALAVAANPGAAQRRLALASLDLAYAAGALRELGHKLRERDELVALVSGAVAAAPGDGAIALGAALLALSVDRPALMYGFLDGALRAAPDASSPLCRNICRTIGLNLGLTDRPALAAAVAAKVGRA